MNQDQSGSSDYIEEGVSLWDDEYGHGQGITTKASQWTEREVPLRVANEAVSSRGGRTRAAREASGARDSLGNYMASLKNFPVLSREEQISLATRAQAGDDDARQRLVESNLRFVIREARKYQGRGLPLSDLVNEGNLGLLKAVDKFDPTHGTAFISYASLWIKQAILEAVEWQGRLVRLPTLRQRNLNKVRRTQAMLKQRLQAEPTVDELADVTGLEPDVVAELLASDRTVVPLEAPLDENRGAASIADLLPDGEQAADAEGEEARLERIHSAFASAQLAEREIKVLSLHYGFADRQEAMGIVAVGDALGISREQVRRIRNKAFERVRNSPEAMSILADLVV